MIPTLRDSRDVRDWRHIWRDPPGLLCCCTSETPMYVCGGTNGALIATAFKIGMTNLGSSIVGSAALTVAKDQHGGAANPGSAGYYAGGATSLTTGQNTTGTDKLTFSNETTAAVTTANLSQSRKGLAGVSERSSKAYFAGGDTGSPAARVATADKLTFSGDSTSAVAGANLSQGRDLVSAITNGSTAGYWLGGSTIPGAVATADKTVFSSDTTSALTTANLTSTNSGLAGTSDGSTKGYVAGGSNFVNKLTFSTETCSNIAGLTMTAAQPGSSSDGTHAVYAGGNTALTKIAGINFSNDTNMGTGATLIGSVAAAPGTSTTAL